MKETDGQIYTVVLCYDHVSSGKGNNLTSTMAIFVGTRLIFPKGEASCYFDYKDDDKILQRKYIFYKEMEL